MISYRIGDVTKHPHYKFTHYDNDEKNNNKRIVYRINYSVTNDIFYDRYFMIDTTYASIRQSGSYGHYESFGFWVNENLVMIPDQDVFNESTINETGKTLEESYERAIEKFNKLSFNHIDECGYPVCLEELDDE
jgi:hypothetical protein